MIGFSNSVNYVISSASALYDTTVGIYELDDRRFEFGFSVMEMLEKEPKIGLDGGWMPSDADPAGRPPPPPAAAAAAAADILNEHQKGAGAGGGGSAAASASAAPGGDGAGDGAPAAAAAAAPRRFQIGGDIEFENVTFRYNGTRRKILRGVSFKIPAGSFVGICGEFGAGKTTLFKLMLRLYDPSSGTITIGGRNIKDYNPVWLRSQIGRCKPQATRYYG